jgi:ubiquinone/menaquinone biosynthesis C-methylase UbiE
MSTKTIQGKLWSVEPEYWSKHFEPWFLPIYKNVLQQLQLTVDDSILEAGCGAGLFSSMVIDTGAQLIGVDAAPGLLDVARRRNPLNNFLEEDLESLPFMDNTFDVVTGFNSFQYAGSFDKAVAEAKRVLKPGGRLVLAIWDKPNMSDGTEVLKAISTLLPPPPPGTPGPFALSEDGVMEEKLTKMGLEITSMTTVMCPFLYSGLTHGIKSYMGTGPAAAAMNNTARKTVEDTIAKALEQYHVTDGFYYMENRFKVFITKK